MSEGNAAVWAAPAPGLVISAISAPSRSELEALGALDASGLWRHAFPSSDLVGVAAAAFPDTLNDGSVYRRGPGGVTYRDARDGDYPLLTIGPGMLHLHTQNWAKAERRAEEAGRRAERGASGPAPDEARDPGLLVGPRGTVAGWSSRSRRNLVRKILSLDLAPLVGQEQVPCMVTLTMPRDWLLFAPSGAHCARLLHLFARAWDKRWGRRLSPVPDPQSPAASTRSERRTAPPTPIAAASSHSGVSAGGRLALWKREFQDRGAPHWHLWTVPPTTDLAAFRVWVSETWNRILWANRSPGPLHASARSDALAAGTGVDFAEGMRARDPKRLAVYFLKESGAASKAYQNEPPAEWGTTSVGRYWGVWGLEEATATVRLSPASYWRLSRILRRLREAHLPRQRVRPERLDPQTGSLRQRRRWVHRRQRITFPSLFVAFNDAPALAYRLAGMVTA